MPNVMAALPHIGGALVQRCKVWLTPTVKIIPFPRVGSLIAFPCFAYVWLSRFWLGLDLWRYGASL